jgi:dienelactone hydrolase
VTLKVYAGATHAFDVPDTELTNTFGHVMAYQTQAAEEAKTELKRFLDQYLKGTASPDQSTRKEIPAR